MAILKDNKITKEQYMPYKSDKQRKFFHAAEERGEISHATVEEYDKASKGKKLPEKVKSKKHGSKAKKIMEDVAAYSTKMESKRHEKKKKSNPGSEDSSSGGY